MGSSQPIGDKDVSSHTFKTALPDPTVVKVNNFGKTILDRMAARRQTAPEQIRRDMATHATWTVITDKVEGIYQPGEQRKAGTTQEEQNDISATAAVSLTKATDKLAPAGAKDKLLASCTQAAHSLAADQVIGPLLERGYGVKGSQDVHPQVLITEEGGRVLVRGTETLTLQNPADPSFDEILVITYTYDPASDHAEVAYQKGSGHALENFSQPAIDAWSKRGADIPKEQGTVVESDVIEVAPGHTVVTKKVAQLPKTVYEWTNKDPMDQLGKDIYRQTQYEFVIDGVKTEFDAEKYIDSLGQQWANEGRAFTRDELREEGVKQFLKLANDAARNDPNTLEQIVVCASQSLRNVAGADMLQDVPTRTQGSHRARTDTYHQGKCIINTDKKGTRVTGRFGQAIIAAEAEDQRDYEQAYVEIEFDLKGKDGTIKYGYGTSPEVERKLAGQQYLAAGIDNLDKRVADSKSKTAEMLGSEQPTPNLVVGLTEDDKVTYADNINQDKAAELVATHFNPATLNVMRQTIHERLEGRDAFRSNTVRSTLKPMGGSEWSVDRSPHANNAEGSETRLSITKQFELSEPGKSTKTLLATMTIDSNDPDHAEVTWVEE